MARSSPISRGPRRTKRVRETHADHVRSPPRSGRSPLWARAANVSHSALWRDDEASKPVDHERGGTTTGHEPVDAIGTDDLLVERRHEPRASGDGRADELRVHAQAIGRCVAVMFTGPDLIDP